MSELTDILELLHDAMYRSETIHAVYDRRVSPPARVRLSGETMPKWELGSPLAGPYHGVMEVWTILPDAVRVDESGHEGLARRLIRQGENWHAIDAKTGASEGVASEPGDRRRRLLPVLDPAPFVGLMRFEARGVGERAGRPTRLARGQIRSGVPGDEWTDLEIDAERGTILARISASYAVVARTIAFDLPIPEEIFDRSLAAPQSGDLP